MAVRCIRVRKREGRWLRSWRRNSRSIFLSGLESNLLTRSSNNSRRCSYDLLGSVFVAHDHNYMIVEGIKSIK